MRGRPTLEEGLLWERLRKSQTGFKFRRQQGIGSYIVDFCCPSVKVIVELDGSQHGTLEGRDYDKLRDAYLTGLDFHVLRIKNSEFRADPQGVARCITVYCEKHHLLTAP